MIIKSILIREGFFQRKIVFSDFVNLIHSNKNSCGKTTLLRLVLYGIGYSVPSTKKCRFDRCEVEVSAFSEKCGDVVLRRDYDAAITAVIDGVAATYVLPDQQNSLHSILFGTENSDILNNILGTFYMDQEKGWTLLNRGTVIGSIHFSIEDLLRGLAGKDCKILVKKISGLQRDLQKYKQLFSVAQYRQTIIEETGNIETDTFQEETDIELEKLKISRTRLKKELKRISDSLVGNNKFIQFISDMKLVVLAPDGTQIRVTKDNLFGLNDNKDLLVAKYKLVAHEYKNLCRQIETKEREKGTEYEQLEFLKSLSQLEVLDKRIVQIPLNPRIIDAEIKRLEKDLKTARKRLSDETRYNNPIVKEMQDDIVKYGTELGIGNEETISSMYLFTSNLRELSGAVLHKTAFAFRLAYIHAVEKYLNIKLPIILDSPSGKEVDIDNVRLMMDILKRDFPDHQIIIASIYLYNFDSPNVIEIKERLIEDEIS